MVKKIWGVQFGIKLMETQKFCFSSESLRNRGSSNVEWSWDVWWNDGVNSLLDFCMPRFYHNEIYSSWVSQALLGWQTECFWKTWQRTDHYCHKGGASAHLFKSCWQKTSSVRSLLSMTIGCRSFWVYYSVPPRYLKSKHRLGKKSHTLKIWPQKCL